MSTSKPGLIILNLHIDILQYENMQKHIDSWHKCTTM